ncbi:NAD(P)-dependent alcohol dehydrogenase [Spongiibacter sp. KMU-166]|uniref:NAD(P)-dependent alcohol dehydrogenase n=1 Tax=Spongiibacter thalassae TaxID=2721624 RepID=A0ABX1GCD7_9GAMM|nr:NAD(P)-dependent alcohol dehydrogenase [Spongiibacter thalassae]NKI16177.1 NAD(P)-dependent alcohol dehydrogenase [Spongiibacter thalassae]
MPTPAKGYAAVAADKPLAPFDFQRRDLGPGDVKIEILYCGVCHSDIHTARNEWGFTNYPIVPGHEIVGRVVEVGDSVTRFTLGDFVGIGCIVDSCRQCAPCDVGDEHYCENRMTGTYGAPERDGSGRITQGGYANNYVIDEHFALRISNKLNLAATAPLLCAGITTWSPLRHWKIGPGLKVGVVGLGGLGHMALKFAHAFGAEVTLFTRSEGKAEDARRLGADHVVLSSNKAMMRSLTGQFDFIIDTVSAQHDVNSLLKLLRRDAVMCMVGMPDQPVMVNSFATAGRRGLTGSMIGGIKETQEMLDFCATHDITADIELINMQEVNEAFDRVVSSDVKYRFVIDMASL